MKYSIVTSYRNRPLENVERCLSSLINQTYKNFELIIIDYGSESGFSSGLLRIINKLNYDRKIRYLYSNSRGLYWNRSHAMNTGLFIASGEYIVTSDIDLIYPPGFLNKIDSYIDFNRILHYCVIGFPKNYSKYDTVFNLDFSRLNYPISDTNGLGLFCCRKEHIVEVGGYDEYFKIWGVEDQDLSKRLRYLGLKINWIPFNESTVVHQWHPTISQLDSLSVRIEGWVEKMKEYYNIKGNNIATYIRYKPGFLFKDADRPVLPFIKSDLDPFVLSYPLSRSFNECLNCFESLKADSPFLVRINKYTSGGKKSTKRRILILVNKIMAKLKSNYLIVRKNEFFYSKIDYPLSPVEAVSLVFYYFLAENERISDYYLDESQDHLDIYLCKS